MKRVKYKVSCTLLLIVMILIGVNAYRNRQIYVSEYKVVNEKLPESFDGYRITQLTDIHSIESQRQQDMIIDKVKKLKPDMIAITGDLVDLTKYHDQINKKLEDKKAPEPGEETIPMIKELVKIAPVYYVYGNHEILVEDEEYPYFKNAIINSGVHLINGKTVTVKKGKDSICIAGVIDPEVVNHDYFDESEADVVKAELDKIKNNLKKSEYTILLSHRPEMFKLYQQYPLDLVLTGHAHGGQFRIPYVKGLFAPGQGFFPTYDAGKYSKNGFDMIVGRGIGNSAIKVRIGNAPEIVSIILNK